ncbi:amidohydrolase family protein [Streptosporangium canum]|uniref:N-acyl-D-amino-acid deacylase family protein n=1 Tax=Streptosporangium canum TaxID=324952 RepID=UPI00343383D6
MYDLVLRGGTVFDGFGTPGRMADVAVHDGRVARVGPGLAGRRVINVEGLAVAPGFVDPHSHSDEVPFLAEAQPFKLYQGVTTEIAGNCGYSHGVLGDYLDAAEAAGTTNNLAFLIGHNTLREAVAGLDRDLPEGGLERMLDLAGQAFAAGAFGFSSGLEYVPGAFAGIDELIALGHVARRWNGTYATHMRSESEGLADALDEAITVARAAGIRLQISHCKASGRAVHGASAELLGKLAAARRSGVDVRGDQYPYQAFNTSFAAVLPPEALEGSEEAMLARLRSPETRAALRKVAEDPARGTGAGFWRELHPDDVTVLIHRDPAIAGKSLADLGGDPWNALCDLVIGDPEAEGVFHTMHADDVAQIMADPLVAIGSDSGPPVGPNHPRTFGTFPRFLGTFVREGGAVPMEEAIRKVTSASAAQFALADRGWLAPGAIADITVFDPETIGHAGTYETPDVRPTGVRYVLLSGRPVVEASEFTGGRHGRILRHNRP